MRRFFTTITAIYPTVTCFHWAMLAYRVLISAQMIFAHGLKKIDAGMEKAEQVPNPLGLPETFNHLFAVSANIIFPLFIILGFFTRLAVLPILAVTLTGYFIVHWNDSLAAKDIPFMYSIAFLLLLVLGPGKYSADYLIHKKIRQ